MNPDHHAKSHYDYFKDLIKGDDVSTEAHRKFYDEYNAVLDMDADYYLDTIKVVFQDFSLVNGTWDVKSPSGKVERVRPSAITTTALMSVEGELDDISGSGQTRAVHDICTGVVTAQQRHFEAKGAGHYGIFSGRRWREQVYPEVKAFIKGHELAKPKAASADVAALAAAALKASAPRAVALTDTAAAPSSAPAPAPAATKAATPKAAAPKKPATKAAALKQAAPAAPELPATTLPEPGAVKETVVAAEAPVEPVADAGAAVIATPDIATEQAKPVVGKKPARKAPVKKATTAK
jgi:poly(3-hydroxybutyrate) depolymerase